MATPLTTSSEWLAANPPAEGSLTETLAGVSAGVRSGEDFSYAAREFLDEFSLRGDDRSRARAIADRPEPTGDARYDAYLGALAEHLAAAHGLDRPAWSIESARFLDRFWFVSEVDSAPCPSPRPRLPSAGAGYSCPSAPCIAFE